MTVNNVAPTIEAITGPVGPIQVGTTIDVSAAFTDPGVLDTHTGIWAWGDESTSAGKVTNHTLSGSHLYEMPGVYTIGLTFTDKDGGVGSAWLQYVVVYDTEGGFVTGGGWINSPAGACGADPSLAGKATFGLVSKYKKAANTPTAESEFQFRVADLNFHCGTRQ